MIGLSLLSTGHPPSFQPRWVRPSTGSYPRFSLPMDSSPGFASTARDCSPHSDSLSLRLACWLNLATHRNSLAHSTKGTPSHTFPSRYWSTIGHRRVFRIGGWTPQLPTGFHVSGGTQVPHGSPRGFAYGALTLSRWPSHAIPLPRGFVTARCAALQPRRRLRGRRFVLGPRSLATTRGISFDFSSSGYLDVSVPPVASARPMCSAGRDGK